MKKFLFLMAIVAGMFASCQDDNVVESVDKDFTRFTATFEKPSSRVYLGDDDYARWDLNDEVSVFGSDHYIYKATDVTNESKTATLKYSGSGEPTFTNSIMAVFPYAADNSLDETNTLYSVLPDEQVYNKAMNNAIMVAVMPVSQADQDQQTFVFKNSCALVKLNINTTAALAGAYINSIKIESKAHNLAGTVKINNDYTAAIENGKSNSIILTGCKDAGSLSETYLSFLLVIPAGIYESGDLTVTVDASNDLLDYTSTIYQDIEVGRSEYFVLETTLGTRVNLVDKAIMVDKERLYWMGGFDVRDLDYEFEIPTEDWSHDFNGKTYNFKATSENVYIINTFTSTISGWKNVTPATLTIENLNITGELRTTTMGIFVKNDEKIELDGCPVFDEVDEYNSNTIWNNVNVLNNKIIPSTEEGVSGANVSIGAAVTIYGTAVLNNCNIYGTKLTDSKFVNNYPNWANIPLYDMACVNSANVTINGGEIGHIYTWEHTDITIQGGAEVSSILYTGIYVNGSFGHLTINDAKVAEVRIAPLGKYTPQAVISKDANIGVLKFESLYKSDGTLKAKADYFANVSIDANAKISKIIVGDKEFTDLSAFLTYMKETEW